MSEIITTKFLSTEKVLGRGEDAAPLNPLLLGAIEKIVGIEKINHLMAEIGPPWPDANTMIEYLFDRLSINWTIENPQALGELDDKPKVFVANHPYGLPDALGMFRLLTKHRPRIRLFANTLLAATQIDDERLLYVDPFMAADKRGMNRKSVASALKHLRSGGDLALFPGRICSHLKTSDWTISDSEWTDQVHRFVEVSGGEMVPMHISGRNSMMFNLSGLVHPRLRTYMLLREFLRGGHDFRFKIGEPLTSSQLAQIARAVSPGQFSRSLTYAMKSGKSLLDEAAKQGVQANPIQLDLVKDMPTDKSNISAKRIEKLVKDTPCLAEQKNFSIYAADTEVSDELLDVICDVRYAAYASESKVDDRRQLLDRFDKHYSHLILWDNELSKIAGVYRYRVTTNIDPKDVKEQLVTGSIFDLSPQFLKILPNSMELGRAAITPEYQKSYGALNLLWRGILEIAVRDKNIKYMFGPVTMGRAFKPVSRELLHRYIMNNCLEEEMDGFVRPLHQLKLDIPKEVAVEDMARACHNFSDVANLISGFEAGKRTLPVLFRHYTTVGCKYLGVAEWPELDHAAAGLTMLDLHKIRQKLLKRYLGAEQSEQFLVGRA